MPQITRIFCYLVISFIASLLSIVIVIFVEGSLANEKTMGDLSYIILLLVMRWLNTLVLGGILFGVLAHLFNRHSIRLWTLFPLALLIAFLMVAFREGETLFRYGLFSAKYFDDIRRNASLFILYVFLVPLLFIPLRKMLARKSKAINMDVLNVGCTIC